MRKIIIVLCSLLYLSQASFAEYIQISQDMSKQYKTEMEQIINDDYSKAIKRVDNYLKEIKIYYKRINKSGYNLEDHINMKLIAEVCMPAAELDIYAKMMKITQEEYLKVKYTPIGTDSVNFIYEFLYPYFNENRVNIKRLNKILIYENKKISIAQKYIQKVELMAQNFNN